MTYKFVDLVSSFQVKAASAPPLETGDRIAEESTTSSITKSSQATNQPESRQEPNLGGTSHVNVQDKENTAALEQLSVSNPEVSFIQRKDSSVSLMAVPEETRTSPSAAVAAAAAAAAVKHPTMRSPMFIRQEVINYLGMH